MRLSGALRELSESGKDRGTSELTESASSSLGTRRGFQSWQEGEPTVRKHAQGRGKPTD